MSMPRIPDITIIPSITCIDECFFSAIIILLLGINPNIMSKNKIKTSMQGIAAIVKNVVIALKPPLKFL